MTLTPEQLHILQHSLGCDKHGRSTARFPSDEPYFRNRYVCDPNPDMDALVAAQLMKDHGEQSMAGGMHCYTVTQAGIAAMREQSPPPPRLTRSQQRYRDYLRADGSETFREWLLRTEHNRKIDRQHA